MPIVPRTEGRTFPLGPSLHSSGANFSLFSRHAQGVDLLLFDHEDAGTPSRTIPFDPVLNRTYHYWHLFVPGLRAGQVYGYRVHGSLDAAFGLRFDREKVLLDPYARAVAAPAGYDRQAARQPGSNAATAMKSVVVDLGSYDWEGDEPLRQPISRTIIYEMHVGGFTRHPSSGVPASKRGTFAGLIEKIPYLQELGVTAVELLPVFQFDAQDAPPGRVNYWGYAPVSFFAPHRGYSSRTDCLGPLDEFRDMVKALHRAGIEVILDVVYNHSAEGDESGPTFGFRGIDNPTYYILESDRAKYANFSGCGNTLNGNHPVVRRMILDSLRFWVQEMHVDGFRFDLASVLARDGSGRVLVNPPILWDIETDPVLSETKLIAEAWDAGGLYQVGSFIGDSWREWNGRFRDDVRSFLRGERKSLADFADRLIGSPSIYGHKLREPEQSVNFVTCHDGFTLNDLVSYDDKHNQENGEHNADGTNDNRSWNCGIEGPTDDPEIERLRNRQVKNFLAITVCSIGVPMLLMGDEARRTQRGNNNAYCHDSELTWLDWSLLERHSDVHRFVKHLLARRSLRASSNARDRATLHSVLRDARHSWHGVKVGQPDWGDDSHSIALQAEVAHIGLTIYLIVNSYWEALEFELPQTAGTSPGPWRRWVDTQLDSPQDIVPWQSAPGVSGQTYVAGARSVVVLFAESGPIG